MTPTLLFPFPVNLHIIPLLQCSKKCEWTESVVSGAVLHFRPAFFVPLLLCYLQLSQVIGWEDLLSWYLSCRRVSPRKSRP